MISETEQQMASKTMKTKVEIDRRHQCFSQQGYHNIRVSPNWKRKSTPRSRPQKSTRSLHNRHSAQFVHRPGYNHAQCSLRASVVELVIHQRIIDPLRISNRRRTGHDLVCRNSPATHFLAMPLAPPLDSKIGGQIAC